MQIIFYVSAKSAVKFIVQERDNIKQGYRKKNNIILLEIKYDEKDKIPEIIDNVLSKINM